MSLSKASFEDSLIKNVVAAEKCVSCGTCVVTCPFSCLELVNEKPVLTKNCEVCGICGRVCPRNQWSQSEAEKFVFGRERRSGEEFGIYRRLAVARAKDKRVIKAGQDGGAVTALLLFALEKELIDGAIISGTSRNRPFSPVPKLATTPEEILESAGTKYSYSPNVSALTDVVKQKKTNVAFVGTPCQIQAIRRIQIAGLRKYATSIRFLIGLLCSGCFTYEGLMQKHIHQQLGINLNGIKKMNIKGKILVTTNTGVTAIPLADAKQYARRSCRFCEDFSSELADISAGGLGLEGWTFTILRTDKGEELFSKAENAGFLDVKTGDKETEALKLLIKLSRRRKTAIVS